MRQLALIGVKIAISAALLYFAMSRIDLGSIGERLNRLDWIWIAAALAILVLEVGLVAIRWRRVVERCGAAMSGLQAFRFNMIAMFFGQVLPSTVGGDAARIWMLARTGAGWRAASYSVLVDRFFGVLGLAVVVVAGLYWSFALIANPVGRLVLLAIGLGSLAAAAAFLAVGYWPSLARWKYTRPVSDMAVLARRLLFSRADGPLIAASSVVVHLMTAAVAWSIARAVAARLGYLDAVLLVLPVMLIATLPISIAGWGVRESALVIAFSYAGLPESDGLIVSVLLGLVTFAVGVIGGIVWLVSRESPRLASAWNAETPLPSD
jgi:uncharacterized membrane protein YbhN (UPF0104 family)